MKFDFKALIDKIVNSVVSNLLKRPKNVMNQKASSSSHFGFFFRERNFSLKIRRIRPSAGFRTRRRNTLRGKGYAWVPDLGSFFKLLEVGFLPTWVLFLLLSVLRM